MGPCTRNTNLICKEQPLENRGGGEGGEGDPWKRSGDRGGAKVLVGMVSDAAANEEKQNTCCVSPRLAVCSA